MATESTTKTSAKKNGNGKKIGALEEKIQLVKKMTTRNGSCTRRQAINELQKKYPDNSISYLRSVVYNQCRALDFLKAEGGLIKQRSVIHFSVKVDPDYYGEMQNSILEVLNTVDGVEQANVTQLWSSAKREEVASGVLKRQDSEHYSSKSRGDLFDYLVEIVKLTDDEADKEIKQRGKVFVYAK